VVFARPHPLFIFRMKSVKFGFVGAVVAGGFLALSCRCYLLLGETSKMRAEAYDFQQFVETQQAQIAAKRQQLQGQQDRLSKGSAIGDTVGPAVLKDIVALAEKPVNGRLRELLQKHGVQVQAGGADSGAQGAKKGGY
jgi:hypothetical protein